MPGPLEAVDLLALTFIKFHLTERQVPPALWAIETVNSARMKAAMGGWRGVALVDFLLDYASTRFREPDLDPGRLASYFDWYLTAKEAVMCRQPKAAALGYEPSAEKWVRISNDLQRFRARAMKGAGGAEQRQALEQSWRRLWDRAAREIDRWRVKLAA
jgi:hypothetical protein